MSGHPLPWGTGAIIALLGLVADITVAMRANVPINTMMDSWSPDDYPAGWTMYRDRWFTAFRYREIILLFGYGSLIARVLW